MCSPMRLLFSRSATAAARLALVRLLRKLLRKWRPLWMNLQKKGKNQTPVEAVAQVLPSTKFLQNIGLQPAVPKRSSKAVVAACVHELEVEVEAEMQGAAALREKFETLNKKVLASEEARERQLEEMEQLRKQVEETNAILRRVFGLDRE
uniref:Uncharacterized protein n=1 Tax=Arundo donax TaxID=35708 RepID=A0A0A8XQ94_ARUDO